MKMRTMAVAGVAALALTGIGSGVLNLLIQHTSASLALNENASPDVRRDFETWFNQAVPDHARYWTHTVEGADDMPAHVRSVLTRTSETIPVRQGDLALAASSMGALPAREDLEPAQDVMQLRQEDAPAFGECTRLAGQQPAIGSQTQPGPEQLGRDSFRADDPALELVLTPHCQALRHHVGRLHVSSGVCGQPVRDDVVGLQEGPQHPVGPQRPGPGQ